MHKPQALQLRRPARATHFIGGARFHPRLGSAMWKPSPMLLASRLAFHRLCLPTLSSCMIHLGAHLISGSLFHAGACASSADCCTAGLKDRSLTPAPTGGDPSDCPLMLTAGADSETLAGVQPYSCADQSHSLQVLQRTVTHREGRIGAPELHRS